MIEAVANAPVFLWGMMGAGKSTVGSRLAQRMGRPFVDLDLEIERTEGRSISTIFEVEGEGSFRQMELSALDAVLEDNGPTVVALGGGTLLDKTVRQRVRAMGPLLTLHAPLETIAARLEAQAERPVLREQSIQTVIEARKAAYEDVDWVIDASSDEPDEVVRAVEAALGLRGDP